MNKELNEKPPKIVAPNKLKKIGKTIGKILFNEVTLGIVYILVVSTIIIAIMVHAGLWIYVSIPNYIDDLDYCQHTYGKGWTQSYTSETGYFCHFTEEDGNKKMIQMDKEDRKSRLCKRKFYHPSYCGV